MENFYLCFYFFKFRAKRESQESPVLMEYRGRTALTYVDAIMIRKMSERARDNLYPILVL